MLRGIVQLFGVALMAAGAWLIIVDARAPGVQMLLLGAIIFVALRFERWRYGAKSGAADAAWQATGERFEDPGSGKTVEVEYNSRTGERRYKSHDAG